MDAVHVFFDPVFLFHRVHPEQFVCRAVENSRQSHQTAHVRRRRVGFPAADRLRGNVQQFREVFHPLRGHNPRYRKLSRGRVRYALCKGA